jgi:hypothetical protein
MHNFGGIMGVVGAVWKEKDVVPRSWSIGSNRRNSRMACSRDSGARLASSAADNSCGIGIAEFLEGKNLLITGGTGFLGKGNTCLSFLLSFRD